MKMYKVTIRGMKSFYVIARDETTAYAKVYELLDKHDLYFEKDRKLYDLKLLGETYYESKEVFEELK